MEAIEKRPWVSDEDCRLALAALRRWWGQDEQEAECLRTLLAAWIDPTSEAAEVAVISAASPEQVAFLVLLSRRPDDSAEWIVDKAVETARRSLAPVGLHAASSSSHD